MPCRRLSAPVVVTSALRLEAARCLVLLSALAFTACGGSSQPPDTDGGDGGFDAGDGSMSDGSMSSEAGMDATIDASSGFTLSMVTPPSASRTVGTTLTITGTNLVSSPNAPTVQLVSCDSPGTAYDLVASNVGTSSFDVSLPADVTRVTGRYTVKVTNGDGAAAQLDCAFSVVAEGPPTVTVVTPSTAWQGLAIDNVDSDATVTITGTGFLSTPSVRFVATTNPTVSYDAPFVGFVSSTELTVVVPSETQQMTAGTYDVFVTNPDLLSAEWMAGPSPGVFTVTATPPPAISDVSPQRLQNGVCTTTPITISGAGFGASATAWLIEPVGTVCAGSDAYVDGRVLCPLAVDSVTAAGDFMTTHLTVCPANGAHPMLVRNPDGQTALFRSIEITPSSDGHLNTGAFTVASSGLVTPRWKHAVQYGFDEAGDAFVYVAGGQDGSGNVLGSVEVSAFDDYGTPGVFRRVQQYGGPGTPRVPNDLGTPRIGSSLVRVGTSLFSIGGATTRSDDTTPVAASQAVERAEILGNAQTPVLAKPTVTSGTSTGSWYYQVSAIGPWGESLPSDEVVAIRAGGSVQICWTGPTGATGYNVYRSLASDGRTGTATAIAYEVPGPCFVDDRLDTNTPAPGNVRGNVVAGGTLSAGSYSYRVSAVVPTNGGGTFESYAGYATTVTIGAGNQSVALGWDPVAGSGVSYRVYRYDTVSGTYEVLGGATALSTTTFTDVGAGFDASAARPRIEVRPLAPGCLSKWNSAPQLVRAREGADAVVVALDPATTNGLVARILVVGGRDGASGTYGYFADSESLGIKTDGTTESSWASETVVMTYERAYHALLSTQGRNVGFPGRDTPTATEPIYVLAVMGDDAFSTTSNTGRSDFEACQVDSSTGHLATGCGFGVGTTWYVQTATEPSGSSSFGFDGVLYFSYLYPFGGAHSETVGSPGTTITPVLSAVVRFPINDLTMISAGQVLTSFQSGSTAFVYPRAYFQMVRLLSNVYAIGGMTSTGPTGTVEVHQQ